MQTAEGLYNAAVFTCIFCSFEFYCFLQSKTPSKFTALPIYWTLLVIMSVDTTKTQS